MDDRKLLQEATVTVWQPYKASTSLVDLEGDTGIELGSYALYSSVYPLLYVHRLGIFISRLECRPLSS